MNLSPSEKLSWFATLVLIVGSAVNGLGYYPLGPLILCIGGLLWLVVAVIRRDWPLMIVNLVMSSVGFVTILYTLSR